jgi:hypothetical protein
MCKWVDNIRTVPRETGWIIVDRIHVAQDGHHWLALVKTV